MSWIEDVSEGEKFNLLVRCPKCRSWKIISSKILAVKGIVQYLKEENFNRFEKIQAIGDYEPGEGGTAIEKYYCTECKILFRLVVDVNHEIV